MSRDLPALDLVSGRFKANPYPLYLRLRADAPVTPTRLRDGRVAWLLVRYADVALALKDPRFAKDQRRASTRRPTPIERLIGPRLQALQFNMLLVDPPDHTRLRKLVHKAFTPRLIEQLRDRIQYLADRLLDEATRRGRFDLVSDYALPIPSMIIADLLGVPASDRHRFQRWSKRLVSITSGKDLLLAAPSGLLFMRYLRRLFAQRRAQPRDDLVTALVQAEEAGDRLTADELLAMVFVLLVAGHETTVNLIANGTLALLEQPDQIARLRREPELLENGSAVEELLRFTGPVQIATERYLLEDVVLSDIRIPKGAIVLASIGSANRDERQFDEPEELDLERTPNPHLSFGLGAHYCLGAPLARLEGQIAFATLLRRVPDMRLGVPPASLTWRPGLFLRGLERLPVVAGGTCTPPSRG
jgi:cytochrome P450 PksS